MKKIQTFAAVLCIVYSATAQQNEFQTHKNGLIYDSTTMFHLSVIIDSLNLKFNSCELDRPYLSLPQGNAHYVNIPDKQAKQLIKAKVAFEEYKKKYPLSIKQKDSYIVQYQYENYKGVNMLEYSGLPGSKTPSMTLKNTKANNKITGWIIKDDVAFYLENLSSQTLSESYGRLIQYVDCMVDTTAQIFLPIAKGETYQSVTKGSAADQFLKWCAKFPDKPTYPDYDENDREGYESLYNTYQKQYQQWDSLRLLVLDEKYLKSAFRKEQLSQALEEAVEFGNSDGMLEFYAGRYKSKKNALTLKRSRKVIGGCSMDDSPRIHASEICMLAAETYQWDIFLRSHLDIMNDRFERVSDGSYAWAGRQTYLKELEELGINAPDLLIGTCFRVKNIGNNHYYGSIGRIGRALAETSNGAIVEETIFNVIGGNKIDLYNRLLFAFLFDHYNYNLDDKERSSRNEEKFNQLKKDLSNEILEILASQS